MDLTLQVDGAKHDSSDLLADRGIVPWVHWLPGLLDAGDLDEPGDRAAQIDEEPERVMTQHYTRRDDPAREACLRYRPFLAGGLTPLLQGTPLTAIWLAHVPIMPQ